MENNTISIIGFGNFGKLAAKHLISAGAEVWVSDASDKSKEAEEIGAKFVNLNEACKNRIVILAVPMENFEALLLEIKDKLQKCALVLDVCSLKMFACEAMNKLLPQNIEIIGTHPLFGPQSAPGSIKGMRIALVNVRARQETFEEVRGFCENLGLKTIVTGAEEHDRQMASSQALTHFIGQSLKESGVKRVEMSTLTFDKLMHVVDIIKNDTPALFNNMQIMNPFAKEARSRFVKESKRLDSEFNAGSSPYKKSS